MTVQIEKFESGPQEQVRGPSRFKIPLRTRLLVSFVILACLCAGVVSSALIKFFNEDKATYVSDLEVGIATSTAVSLELLLESYRARLNRMAGELGTADASREVLQGLLEQHTDCVYLAVYDASQQRIVEGLRGRRLRGAGIDPGVYSEARLQLEESPRYLALHGFVMRNSTVSAELPTYSMTLPFAGGPSGEDWFIRADWSASLLLRAVELAPGYATYVVDENGGAFLHPDRELMIRGAALTERQIVQDFLGKQVRSSATSGEYVEPDGQRILASYATVGSSGLGVIVERPKQDAYLGAARLRNRSLRVACLILAAAILLSVVLSRALTARLLKLSAAARELERGNFQVRVVEGARDELGDVERSINMAAVGLEERDLELRRSYEELAQSDKLAGLGRLAAGIVHEIKNPLSSMSMAVELASMQVGDDHPAREDLRLVMSEIDRCSEILQSLLGFARRDEGTVQMVSLHRTLEELCELMSPQLRTQGVALRHELNAVLDQVLGNKNQLTQVFMNLVLNAGDAMAGAEEKRVEILSRDAAEGRIEVLVRDTGSGIPEDKLRHIFDPFFTTKEKGKGTGLGLYMSYTYVKQWGGTIAASSQPGQGTEFRLSFPLAAEATAQLRAVPEPSLSS